MKKKYCLVKISQRKEIMYNIINALLAGCLVLLGSFSTGSITVKGFLFALLTSMAVAIAKFKEYWDGEKGEYSSKLLSFIQA